MAIIICGSNGSAVCFSGRPAFDFSQAKCRRASGPLQLPFSGHLLCQHRTRASRPRASSIRIARERRLKMGEQYRILSCILLWPSSRDSGAVIRSAIVRRRLIGLRRAMTVGLRASAATRRSIVATTDPVVFYALGSSQRALSTGVRHVGFDVSFAIARPTIACAADDPRKARSHGQTG